MYLTDLWRRGLGAGTQSVLLPFPSAPPPFTGAEDAAEPCGHRVGTQYPLCVRGKHQPVHPFCKVWSSLEPEGIPQAGEKPQEPQKFEFDDLFLY